MPKGGPDGGDGGRGGDVVFVVRRNLKTLSHLRMRPHYRAENGRPGAGRNMHGRDGESAIIPVPPGTIVREPETGKQLVDLTSEDQSVTMLRGGRGGKGNAHFATARHQTPRFSQSGEPGADTDYIVELAVIADIGFVGFPNAGKSSLLKALTNADPRVASYAFTTKTPNLGVLHVHDRDIVLADIPGIIEGASEGAGLGLRFLKHISRAVGIALLVDLSNDDFLDAYPVLMEELRSYSGSMESKRRFVIGTKLDMPGTENRLEELKSSLSTETVVGVSAFTRAGLDSVAGLMFTTVVTAENEEGVDRTMRLAIFGGTFDPIHIGHLSIAEEVRVSLGYDQIIFVPANIPPHKPPSQMISAGDRLELVRLGISDNRAFRLETSEVDRGGVSYSIDTIRQIIEASRPVGRPGLIIGDDLIAGFPRWKEAEKIGALCDLIVARRVRANGRSGLELPDFISTCREVDNLLVPVSSSDIRERIRVGRSFRYLVPERVYEYISNQRLYQA